MFVALATAIDGLTISTTEELAAALALADRLRARISAAVDEIHRTGSFALDGALSMTGWLTARARCSRAAASATVATAARLRALPTVQHAWDAGVLSADQVRAVAHTVDRRVVDQFDAVAAELMSVLAPLPVADVIRAIEHWNAHATRALDDPPPREPAGFHLDKTLDGGWRGDLTLDAQDGEVVSTALHRALDRTPPTEGEPARSLSQRRADALVDLCRYFLDHHQSSDAVGRQKRSNRRRSRPHVNLVAMLDDAANGGVGQSLVTGQTVTDAWLREVACDCTLHRVLLGGDSEILDYGRSQRVVPSNLFHAIVVRDRHCRYPGCDRPPDWCDAHHVVHWLDNGPTSLANCLLLCRRHHRRLHQPGYRVALHVDGAVTVTTPAGTILTSGPSLRPPVLSRAGP